MPLGARKLALEEALRELARSRRFKVQFPRPPALGRASRTSGNLEEESTPRGEAVKWGIAALIAFATIDWFAAKLL